MPSEDTAIGWTDDAWNPIHGCFKVSEGCLNCYAANLSYKRFGHTPKPWTAENAEENVRLQEGYLYWPDKPDGHRRIFVNSMSDLFAPRELVPDHYLNEVMDVIERNDEHVFIALTKHGTETGEIHGERPRLLDWDEEYNRWPDNLWMGVSVENADRQYRIDVLDQTDAALKWVSFEPLIGPVNDPDLSGMDWVVVGGESLMSDEKRREMDHEWAREIRDAAKAESLPFFFKQSSGKHQGYRPLLAELGHDVDYARWHGGTKQLSRYEEFPPLPDDMLAARPDLQELVVDA